VKAFDGWHQAMGWRLLALIGIHVATAMVHLFIYRDRIMQRMLPG
jgi:cytochrome b561